MDGRNSHECFAILCQCHAENNTASEKLMGYCTCCHAILQSAKASNRTAISSSRAVNAVDWKPAPTKLKRQPKQML